MTNLLSRIFLFGIIYLTLTSLKERQKATISTPITIKNIRNTKGRLSIGVFKDAKTFDVEKPHKIILVQKKDLTGGTLKTTIELEPGVYGLSILDDENNDHKMEYNMVGMPKEGFGFSNYYHTGFTKPDFKQFLVKINTKEKDPIVFQIRYIL
jgi:uncharacterized protein (DUF2141 family)